MKFAVDKIENNIVVLENIHNNDIIEVDVKYLPVSIKENDIIRFEDGKYVLDINEKTERINRIKEKMNSLKK